MEARHRLLRDGALHLLDHGAQQHAHRGGEDLFVGVGVGVCACGWVWECLCGWVCACVWAWECLWVWVGVGGCGVGGCGGGCVGVDVFRCVSFCCCPSAFPSSPIEGKRRHTHPFH